MKRCPQCGREYDATMSYCLDDGSGLLYGPALSGDGPATAILRSVGGKPAPGMASDDGETCRLVVPFAPLNKNSIAVLPFINISADDENEYFCDGLAEELLNALSKIEELKVAARTSAFSFKGKSSKVSEIGEALGVRNVLEGSVRKSGDKLRIAVQLVNAADGYQLWSERYDRETRDIFAVQDEIALAVVEALKVNFLNSERFAVLKKATDNPEAFQLYLRGRAYWNRRTPADLQKAIENFEQAIEIDSEYSLAYAGLADSYSLLVYFEAIAPDELREKARVSAARALEFDENSAESHTAMALYCVLFEFDPVAADLHFERAIRLDPRLVQAHYLYCTHLTMRLRFEEAFAHARIALELDPLSPPLNGNVARVLYHGRRFGDAIELAEKNLELSPEFFFLHWVLGVSYRETQQYEKAIDHLQTAVSLSGFTALKGDLGVALANAGRVAEARNILAELVAESEARYVSPQWPAVIYVALGETATAFSYLEKALEARSAQLVWLRVDPNFDRLRGEDKFVEILERSGL